MPSGRACLTDGTRPLTVLPVLPKLVGILWGIISSRHVVAPQLSQRVHIKVRVSVIQLSCLWATSLPLQRSKGTVRWRIPGGTQTINWSDKARNNFFHLPGKGLFRSKPMEATAKPTLFLQTTQALNTPCASLEAGHKQHNPSSTACCVAVKLPGC